MSVTDSNSGLDDEQLETIYGWVDEVPLSRPKKSISRDFADGGMYVQSNPAERGSGRDDTLYLLPIASVK